MTLNMTYKIKGKGVRVVWNTRSTEYKNKHFLVQVEEDFEDIFDAPSTSTPKPSYASKSTIAPAKKDHRVHPSNASDAIFQLPKIPKQTPQPGKYSETEEINLFSDSESLNGSKDSEDLQTDGSSVEINESEDDLPGSPVAKKKKNVRSCENGSSKADDATGRETVHAEKNNQFPNRNENSLETNTSSESNDGTLVSLNYLKHFLISTLQRF